MSDDERLPERLEVNEANLLVDEAGHRCAEVYALGVGRNTEFDRDLAAHLAASYNATHGKFSVVALKAGAVERTVEALRSVEWVAFRGVLACPSCGQKKTAGHMTACKLNAVLAALNG